MIFMSSIYTYRNDEEIKVGDLITVDYGYEYWIVLKLLFDEEELKSWGWSTDPGPGVFGYNYGLGVIDYLPIEILQSEETELLGRCPKEIFREDIDHIQRFV